MADLDRIQKFYIAYYGRPADPVGLNYWATTLDTVLNGNETEMVKNFGAANQPEFQSVYPNLSIAAFINSVYQNLFNRAPDTAGLNYWIGQYNLKVAQGMDPNLVRAQMVMWIVDGAQGADATSVANKLTAANAFTAAIDTVTEIAAYSDVNNTAGLQAARDWLKTVDDTAASVTAAQAQINTVTQNVVTGSQQVGGQTFTLTANTAVLTDSTSSQVTPSGKLTSANETIDALNLLSSNVVIKDPSASDNDLMKVILTAAAAPLVQNIETIELTVTNALADLQMTNITGTKQVVLKGDSTAGGKVSSLPTSSGPTIVLDAGYNKTLTLAQTTDAGSGDSLTVQLKGTGSKAALTVDDGTAGGALETLNLEAAGSAASTLTVSVNATNTTKVAETKITGSQNLTLIAAADAMLSGTAQFEKIDATGHTGQLTLQIGADSATTAITDTSISLANYKGVDRVVLNDDTVVTVSNAASGIVVDANSDNAFGNFTISGNSSVAATASNADVATLNLTSKTGTIMSGTVTFTGFETLIINSTNVNHTITGALTTGGSPTALDTVKIGGNKDLTLTAAPSGVEKIDATGFTGKLIMGAAGAAMLEIVGGDGNDTIYGGGNTSSATVVNMGKGDDTYVFGAQSDVVTGGDGADTFNASTLANTVLVSSVADKIMDFTSGTDKIKVGATIDGNTTNTTLAVQTLTWNTNLATTLGAGSYSANTAHFVKISGGSADGNYYLILNDGTAGFSAAADGVIQIIGSTTITADDIIA